MSNEARAILKYLQNECSDCWCVCEHNGFIKGYYTNICRFLIFKDDYDEWCITGEELPIDMIYDIKKFLD